jgi:dissimilatory sulfite reductase related protein
MSTIEFEDKIFAVDEDGFLERYHDWCPEWVEYVRTAQKIEAITDEHWRLISVLQSYYEEHGAPPIVRILSKATGFKMKHIFALFPAGPGKGACKMAGLPKPKGCV